MKHPGINRAIPGALIGFIIGELIVMGIRTLQGLPAWDPGVALVLAPFTMMGGWLWGAGAFNPKLSEHGEHHDEADGEHHEETYEPGEAFFTEFWKSLSLPLVILSIVFLFALIPGGFYLPVVDGPNASLTNFSTRVELTLPFFGDVVTTQMLMFLAFVGFLGLSLLVTAGILSFLLYKGHEQVLVANEMEAGPKNATPPAPVRAIGRGAKNAARSARKNLPKVLGSK